MKIGASRYHPGLTVRWKRVRHGRTAIALYGKGEHASFAMISEWDGVWYWIARGSGKTARRCDAKRAAEVLVGQWWREKCGREAKAKRYACAKSDGLTAAFKRIGETAREATERFNVLTARGGDLDRLAEAHGVGARGGE